MSNNPGNLPNLIITRFSFLGNSGWKIPEADREAILFDSTRLEMRLWLFERITLASLLAQTDQSFHHYILTSDRLPDWALKRLRAILKAAYPEDRYTIARKPIGPARKFLREFMEHRKYQGPVVQIVLDDDDGLSCDFIATVAEKLALAAAEGRLAAGRYPCFLSFSRGYGLVFPEASRTPQVFQHRYPYINLGLTMVDSPDQANILAIDHLAAPKKAGCLPIAEALMFVRSVHGFNDSRVAQTEAWKPVAEGLDDAEMSARFGYLRALQAEA